VKVRVELYGRLRDASLGPVVTLDLPENAKAKNIILALKSVLGRRAALVDGCVVASHSAVLASNDVLPKNARLAVLPPVCGG
jgi:molybdopterin converting factor small subunit